MNAATISRTLALIPDRLPRTLSGSIFNEAEAAASKHPERIAHVMKFLSWLGPLNPLTKDDLRVLGLLNQYGKPLGHGQAAEDMGDDEDTLESDEELESLDEAFAETTLPAAAPQASAIQP
jgi:hypothetical protein